MENLIIKTDYQMVDEICRRMGWGKNKTIDQIKHNGFPAVKIGREYRATEVKIQEWLNKKIDDMLSVGAIEPNRDRRNETIY